MVPIIDQGKIFSYDSNTNLFEFMVASARGAWILSHLCSFVTCRRNLISVKKVKFYDPEARGKR